MSFVRVVKNSNDLENFIDIPRGLKNRKVEVIILPFADKEDAEKVENSEKVEKKSLRGILSKYKNEALQDRERDAWSKAVVDNYENS